MIKKSESHSLIKEILKYLIYPLLVLLVGTLLFSKINTNDWWKYVTEISTITWLLFVVGVLILIVIIQYLKSKTKVKGYGSYEEIPMRGWTESKQIKVFGVWWMTRYPTPNASILLTMEGIELDELDIKLPPLCPECKTELKETRTFWKKYLWSCVNCNFKIKQKESYYELTDDVLKICKSDLRRNFKPSS